MKKLISFIVLLALSISLFGCAKAPIDSASPYALIENKRPTDDVLPATDVQTPDETLDQTPQESADGADADIEPDYSATVTPAVTLPSLTVKQNEGENNMEAVEEKKFVPQEFTIEDEFSPYEIVITLTEEESINNRFYLVEDFPNIDIYAVFLQESYYGITPSEFKNCRTLIALLNEPSKERVLEYCKELEKDERVLFARPCIDEITNKFWFYATKDLRENPWNLTDDSFPELSIMVKHYGNGKNNNCTLGTFIGVKTKEEIYKQIKNAVNCDKIEYVEPIYTCTTPNLLRVYPTEERMMQDKKFSVDEFPEADLKWIYYDDRFETPYLHLYFKSNDKKVLDQAYKALSHNPIVKSVHKEIVPDDPITGYITVVYRDRNGKIDPFIDTSKPITTPDRAYGYR